MYGKQSEIEALIFDKDPEIILEKDFYTIFQKEPHDPIIGRPVRRYHFKGCLLGSGFLKDSVKNGRWYTYRDGVVDTMDFLRVRKIEPYEGGARHGMAFSYNSDGYTTGCAWFIRDKLIFKNGSFPHE